MTQVPQNGQFPNMNFVNTPSVQSYTPAINMQDGKTVSVTPNNSAIYQYPQASVYDANAKQAASGVNIYICNPTGYGAPPANTNYCYNNYSSPMPQLTYPGATGIVNTSNNSNMQASAAAPLAEEKPSQALASSPVSANDLQTESSKKKQVVELSDDYIKLLESYLTNSNSSIRRQGIEDLIKRFEEDPSREKDPALTALLNIALQDPKPSNRLLAMSPLVADVASGDENTLKLLENLKTSDKVYGQEGKTASNAILHVSRKQN